MLVLHERGHPTCPPRSMYNIQESIFVFQKYMLKRHQLCPPFLEGVYSAPRHNQCLAWLALLEVLQTGTWVASSTKSCFHPTTVTTGILAYFCSPTSPTPTWKILVQEDWCRWQRGQGLGQFFLSVLVLLTLWGYNSYTVPHNSST